MKSVFVVYLLLAVCLALSSSWAEFTHPCQRECLSTTKPMKCLFEMTIAWSTTMNPRSCLNCGPKNHDHCERPSCMSCSGGRPRPVLVANNAMPGPVLVACLGDRIRIQVDNLAQNGMAVALNFGIRPFELQANLTSSIINAGVRLVLDFEATGSNMPPPGTYLWYASNRLQRFDGLSGALIIRDPDDTYLSLYDNDSLYPVIMQDWLPHLTGLELFLSINGGLTPSNLKKLHPQILVNGRWPNEGQVPPYTYKLDPSQRYRLRIVNSVSIFFLNEAIKVEITGHNLVIIARNGQPLETPIVTRVLSIFPNERYDVVPYFSGDGTVSRRGIYYITVKAAVTVGAKSFARIIYEKGENPRPTTALRASGQATKRVLDEFPDPDPDINQHRDVSGGLYGPQCRYNLIYPHVLCLPDSPQLISLGLNSRVEILDRHNYFRATVKPAAKIMPQLQWDDDLAVAAERWAAQCKFEHSPAADRSLPQRGPNQPAWPWIGENICWADYTETWTECINSWALERRNWGYGVGPLAADITVGHYTQIIWANTLFVGCGRSHCRGTDGEEDFYLQVCLYGPGGNIAITPGSNPYATPYQAATE